MEPAVNRRGVTPTTKKTRRSKRKKRFENALTKWKRETGRAVQTETTRLQGVAGQSHFHLVDRQSGRPDLTHLKIVIHQPIVTPFPLRKNTPLGCKLGCNLPRGYTLKQGVTRV
jgi:hypothetical protein